MSETQANPPRKSTGRRIGKWALIAFGVLVGLIVLAVLAVRFAAQTSLGRDFVESRIESAAPSGQDIDIEGLEGDLLGTFRIARLTVSDEEGVWLVAEDVLADWQPLALRNRALNIDTLEADLVHVLRQPMLEASNQPQQQDGSSGSPIRRGRIDTLRIGELRTDEGVLPEPVSLSVNGEGRVGQDGGQAELSVVPLEGDGDTLNADLSWSQGFRVDGTLQLEGPAGGLFATLARLDPGQSISAQLAADGELEDWRADGAVRIDGETALDLDASAEGETIGFDLVAHPGLHPLTARFTDTLGDTLSVEGRMDRAPEEPVLDISAEAEGLQLEARTRLGSSGAYAAEISLRADQPTRYVDSESISVGAALLDGTLVYDQGTVRYEGQARASGVDVPSFEAESVSGPLRLVYGDGTVSVTTTLTGDGAVLPGFAGRVAGSQPVLKLNGQYDLDSGTVSVRELNVTSDAARIAGAGTLSFAPSLAADFSGSFQLDGKAAGLARPVQASGQVSASRTGQGGTQFEISANATQLGALPAPLSDWMGEQANVTAEGTLAPGGQLTVPALSAESGTLRINGSLERAADGQLDAQADVSAGEASLAGIDIASIAGRVEAGGSLDALDLSARLRAPAMRRGELTLADVVIGADGRYANGGLNADLGIDARTSEGPLDASANLVLKGSRWQLNGLDASWDTLEAQGSLAGNGGNLGALRGELVAAGALPEGLPAERIDVTASIEGESLAIDATLESLSFGPTQADALVFRVSGSPDNADFLIDMDGTTELSDLSHQTSLDMDGHVEGLVSGNLDLTASLSAVLGEVGLTTQQPIRFTRYEDGFDASARFAALGGTLAPQVTTRGETQISVDGSGLEIGPLLVLAGRPSLDGALDLNVDLSEVEGGLAGPVSAELRGVTRSGSDLQPIDLFVDGELQPTELDLTVRALDNSALEAVANLQVPVTTSPSLPFIQPVPGAEIPIETNVRGQIEAVAALLLPPQINLKGEVDATVSGNLPQLDEGFQGQVSLSNGEFEHGELGLVLNQIEATADIGGGALRLRNFDARGRSGGTLSGSGSMAIDGSGVSDLELTADELVVTERREGRATVSGDLQINQQPNLLEITGDLTVDEGTINIDKLPTGGPPTLDVAFQTPEEEAAETDDEQAATRLDISLDAPGQINLRGRGINAELSLDAEIQGTAGDPVITGEAAIVRGRFDLLGKRFELSSDSRVRLAPDLGSSRLNVTARHETRDDITAVLNVTGTIDRPEIELTSEPDLPEDEVLSRVLFGRSPSQLTGLEAARLAAALAQLSGGGGFDLVGDIGQALGLDTLDVGQSSGGDVQVTSGKYLTDNVYLEVRSGAAGAPGIAIEWEPIENIEVEAATGGEDGQELSVQWTRDFDDGAFPGVSPKRDTEAGKARAEAEN